MSIKGISVVIVFLICVAVAIWLIFTSLPNNAEPAIAILLVVAGSVGGLLFQPIRTELQSFINGLFARKSIYRICIFGRPGSGKSTFIETAFTLIEPDRIRKSTEAFDYYLFEVQLNLKTKIDVAVADYKGQNPSQIILHSPANFFGYKGERMINAVLFIVDLVPRKIDDQGNPLNDEDLLSWLKKDGDIVGKIESRIKEHYDYINESTLELLFASLYSENLKTVRLLINKVDLIHKLIDDGHLTLSNYRNAKEYAEHHFESMIKNIYRACSGLKIEDFSVSTVCAKKTDDLRPSIVSLLSKRS